MQAYQRDFVKLALENDVLRFGSFTLKSGRVSPYFFNLGQISTGTALRMLADAYAAAIVDAGIAFDLLFGPAYKGIPLAAAVSVALAQRGHDVAFAYNRKEAKDHGEGGMLVGSEVKNKRVLIIDDVLTAGTAMRQSITLLENAGASPVAAIIALDRQEHRPDATTSAVDELAAEAHISVHAIVGVNDVLEHLVAGDGNADTIAAIRAYQQRYGTAHADGR